MAGRVGVSTTTTARRRERNEDEAVAELGNRHCDRQTCQCMQPQLVRHQPRQRCKYTTSVGIQKTRYKARHSCRAACERSGPAQKSGE